MPPLARMVVTALSDLARQLRFAPREALMRDIERAEALVLTIDPDAAYQEDWIIGQVTGYRPRLESPAVVAGAALLADLSALVEHLSDAANLTDADMPAGWVDPVALASRWGVSRKTLDRYRKRGLVARRIVGERGRVRLGFAPGVVEAFAARERASLDRAAGFSRISASDGARMVRRAARYRRRFGCTLNEAAKRLAARFGRSHEAVRQVLRRHDRDAGEAQRIFTEPGPPDARFERLAWRVWRRGLDPGVLARRSERSRVSVVRAVNQARAARLRAWASEWEPLDAATDAAARLAVPDVERTLASEPVRAGLGAPGITDARAWIEACRRAGAPLGVEERFRLQGYRVVLWRAAAIAMGLSGAAPRAERLDEAETLLRWAARLKAELVRAQQGLVLRTLEARLGRALEEVRAADLTDLVRLSVRAVGDAIDAHDPFAGGGRAMGRLAAPAGLALDRAVARWLKEHERREAGKARATGLLTEGATLPDWTLSIAPWQAWTEPDPRTRIGASMLPERAFLQRRFGWDGGPPATLDEVAHAFGLTRIEVVRRERSLVRAAIEAARSRP